MRRLFGFGGETLAAVFLFFVLPLRRRNWHSLAGMLILVFLLTAVSGCGGTSKPVPPPTGGSSGGTTPGSYVVTVTGTSGALNASSTVSFTVQ